MDFLVPAHRKFLPKWIHTGVAWALFRQDQLALARAAQAIELTVMLDLEFSAKAEQLLAGHLSRRSGCAVLGGHLGQFGNSALLRGSHSWLRHSSIEKTVHAEMHDSLNRFESLFMLAETDSNENNSYFQPGFWIAQLLATIQVFRSIRTTCRIAATPSHK